MTELSTATSTQLSFSCFFFFPSCCCMYLAISSVMGLTLAKAAVARRLVTELQSKASWMGKNIIKNHVIKAISVIIMTENKLCYVKLCDVWQDTTARNSDETDRLLDRQICRHKYGQIQADRVTDGRANQWSKENPLC